MNERALIYFLIFIIWSQVSWRWYTTEIRGFYRSDSSSHIHSEESSESKTAILDMDSSSSPFELRRDGAILFFPYKSVSQNLDEKLRKHLFELAKKAMNSNSHIQVIGHTDRKGSDSYNKRLGKERAERVADILEGYGVNKGKLKVMSKGEKELLYTNEQEGPAAMNRRVEVILSETNIESNN